MVSNWRINRNFLIDKTIKDVVFFLVKIIIK